MDASAFFGRQSPNGGNVQQQQHKQQQQNQYQQQSQNQQQNAYQHYQSQQQYHPAHQGRITPPIPPTMNLSHIKHQQHPRHHMRTLSHTSYTSHGSHNSHNSAMFETCDLDSAQEFFSAPSPTMASQQTSGANQGNGAMTRGGMATTSNEDFSNYNHPNNSADQGDVHYEGVALQTALSAFGNVALAVGGMASNVRGGMGGATAMATTAGGMMSSLTPGRLANNMSSWRGRLAEVVAPVDSISESNFGAGQQMGEGYGGRGGESAAGVFGSGPVPQQQQQQQQQPPSPMGYSETQQSHAQSMPQKQGQQSAQDLFGTVPPVGSAPKPPSGIQNHNRMLSNPSPNSSFSWQMVEPETPLGANNFGNEGYNGEASQQTSMEFQSAQPPALPINTQPPAQQRPPLSHQLSSLEKAKHDSTTFQYSDPLEGNISTVPASACTVLDSDASTLRAELTTVTAAPPTGGVNAMEFGKYTANVAIAGEIDQGGIASVEGAVFVPPATPMTAMDMFVSHSTASLTSQPSHSNQHPLSMPGVSTSQPPAEPFSYQPSTAQMRSAGPSSTRLAQPATKSTPSKATPSAPRSGNRPLKLNVPKKANLPLPPPMPRKKLPLPTTTDGATSSIGGDSRSSHRGFAVPSSTHFKKPPPMEVSADSPRFATPSAKRIHTTLDGPKKLAEMSPLPSPRFECKQDAVESVSVAPLEEEMVVNGNEKDEETVVRSNHIVEDDGLEGRTEMNVHSGAPPPRITPIYTAPPLPHSLPFAPVLEGLAGSGAPPIPTPSAQMAAPMAAPMAQVVQNEAPESLKDWNMVASSVVRKTLDDAVNRVAAEAITTTAAPPAPPSEINANQEHAAHSVTFSAIAPPVYHGRFPDAESSRVTECDVMSDYQSFVRDEDVPPIQEGLSHDDVGMMPLANSPMLHEERGVMLDSSMVAECDTMSDYQAELKDLTENDCVELVDQSSGNRYYLNNVTGESSWDKPTQMPSPEDTATENLVEEESPSNLIESADAIGETLPETEQLSEQPVYQVLLDEGEPNPNANAASMKELPALTEEPLPSGWEEAIDEGSGRVYYFDNMTGDWSWDRPNFVVDPTPSEVADEITEDVQVEIQDVKTSTDGVISIGNTPLDHDAREIPEENIEESPEQPSEELATKIIDTQPSDNNIFEEVQPMSNGERLTPSAEPLPYGWVQGVDESSGRSYFHNEMTGESSWERPPPAAIVDSIVEEESSHKEATQSKMSAKAEPECTETIPTEEERYGFKSEKNADNGCREPTDANDSTETLSTLPEGWVEAKDPSNKVFYWCQATGQCTWERPVIKKGLETADESPAAEYELELKPSHDDVLGAAQPEDVDDEMVENQGEDGAFLAEPTEEFAAQEEDEIAHADNPLSSLEALLPGWIEVKDSQSGSTYYYNEITNESRWDMPAESNVDASDEIKSKQEMNLPAEATDNPQSELVVVERDEGAGPVADAGKSHGESDADNLICEEAMPDDAAFDSMGSEVKEVTKEEQEAPSDLDEAIAGSENLAPLPIGWQEVIDPSSGNPYFYNDTTGEALWERPAESKEAVVDDEQTEEMTDGPTNVPQTEKHEGELLDDALVGSISDETEEIKKEEENDNKSPVGLQEPLTLPDGWEEVVDPSTGLPYFYNATTDETSWQRPMESTGSEVDSDRTEDMTDYPSSSLENDSNLTATVASTIEETAQAKEDMSATEKLPDGWKESKDQTTGKVYYYNEETGESLWDRPVLDHKTDVSISDPDAAEAVAETREFTEPTANVSKSKEKDAPKPKTEAPALLPPGWTERVDPPTGNVYFYNEETGESAWNRPEAAPSASTVEIKDEALELSLKTVVETSQPTQLELGWKPVIDEVSGRTYYFNEDTNETTWDRPVTTKHATSQFTANQTTSAARGSTDRDNRGRPAHAIASFGFGGKLCVMIPQVAKSLSGSAKLISTSDRPATLRRGPVVVHQLRNLIPRDNKYSITPPLYLPMIKSRDEDVLAFLAKKCEVPGSLIWNVVNICAQNGGRLKDEKAESGHGPASAVVDLLLSSNLDRTGAHGDSLPQSPTLKKSNEVPPSDANTNLEEIQNMLMRGDREDAVDEALDNKNYAVALVLAANCGAETFSVVTQRFANEVLSPGSPLHTITLMLSQNLTLPTNEELSDPHSDSFWSDDIYDQLGSTWKHQLASILSNRKDGWTKFVLTLGDRLMQLGQFEGAHICYLMCGYHIGANYHRLPVRVLLLGCDHENHLNLELMTPESIDGFLCTEAFEWARRKGNKRTFLHSFQQIKLRYAELLSDFGYTELAREYVVTIRHLTGLGLAENESSRAPPPSGNVLGPYPPEFIDQLYRFEDRLCVSMGTELSCKKKESEEYWKSKLVAITGGLGSVFARKSSSEGKGHKKINELPLQEEKLDDNSSDNEFMASLAATSKGKPKTDESDHVKSHKRDRSVGKNDVPKTEAPLQFTPFNAVKPPAETTPQQFTPLNSVKSTADQVPTGVFPPVSAPPTLGKKTTENAKPDEPKPKEPTLKEQNVTSTPSIKSTGKKAPASEPPRSAGWLAKLLGRDKDSKAVYADTGDKMEAYYDEKLKRWIFPGDDPAEVAKPLAPPPIMTPKTDSVPAPSSTPASNDPLAALMAPPPSRVMSSKKSASSSRSRYADPLASMGNVSTSNPMMGMPPTSSKNVPESPMRIDVTAAAPPKFAVFQPKPVAGNEAKSGDEKEN